MTDDTTSAATTSTRELEALRSRFRDRYHIERELGRGGMGAVYLARDVRLDRHVALKVLPPEFASQAALRDRFLRETRTAASFSHPNIVPVYAVEETSDFLCYAMGYVEGESLTERVYRAGPLSVRDTVKLMQDVAYALAYAHGRGIVHRDIKPDNIMIDRASGRTLVMDFGIARAKSNASVNNAGLTRVGEVVGTPEYMSPEQASGDDVDGRSDLYSLGLAIMFALTGRQAVTGDSTQKVLVKQLTEQLPSVTTLRSDLPDELAAAVDRCVLKDPNERFATAEELVEALDATQLATPEIPLAIRMLAQDVTALSAVIAVAVFFVALVVRSMSLATKGSDAPLLIVVVMAVAITRVMQTLKEAGRLAFTGFTVDEIVEGFRRVVDERAQRRAELRADPNVVRARRRTVVMAIAMLVGALGLFFLTLKLRIEVAPGSYYIGWRGVPVIISSMTLLGVSLVLLLKSPLKMPIGERLFRVIWLGPVGRAFLRFSGRKAKRQPNVVAPRRQSRVGSVSMSNTAPVKRHTNSDVSAPIAGNSHVVNAQAPERASGSESELASALWAVNDRLSAIENRLENLERGRS